MPFRYHTVPEDAMWQDSNGRTTCLATFYRHYQPSQKRLLRYAVCAKSESRFWWQWARSIVPKQHKLSSSQRQNRQKRILRNKRNAQKKLHGVVFVCTPPVNCELFLVLTFLSDECVPTSLTWFFLGSCYLTSPYFWLQKTGYTLSFQSNMALQ